MEFNRDRSTWELSKENILPLSSGRRISQLTQSLDTTAANKSEFESDFRENLRNFEEEVQNYIGDDPLEPWVRIINYLDQICLTGGKKQCESLLHRCVRLFFNNTRYKNDKRFVEIFLKSLSTVPSDKKVQIIRNVMKGGVGVKVAKIYFALANEYEQTGKLQAAMDVIKNGIKDEAEPLKYLEEYLIQLQYAIAKNMAQTLNDENPIGLRDFGRSVPLMGDAQEAVAERVFLSPSNPIKTKSILKNGVGQKRGVLLVNENFASDENENEKHDEEEEKEKAHGELQNFNMAVANKDKENEINPGKWNKDDQMMPQIVHIEQPVIAFKVFEEPEESLIRSHQPQQQQQPTKLTQHENVLAEREEKEIVISHYAPVAVPPLPPPPTIAESLPKEREVPPPPLPTKIPKEKEIVPPPIPPENPKEKIMYRKNDLFKNGRELTFEHIRAEEYRKRRVMSRLSKVNCKRGIHNQGKSQSPVHFEGSRSDSSISNNNKDNNNGEKEKIQKCEEEIFELKLIVKELKRKIEDEQKEKYELISSFQDKENKMNQDIEKYIKIMDSIKEENNELTNTIHYQQQQIQKLQQQQHQMQQLHQQQQEMQQQQFQQQIHLHQQQQLQHQQQQQQKQPLKMAFQVFEEQEPEENWVRPAQLQLPTKLPSESSKRNEIVLDEETDYLIGHQGEKAVDMNISNLTRALAINPRPLGNSTPERAFDLTTHSRIGSGAHITPFKLPTDNWDNNDYATTPYPYHINLQENNNSRPNTNTLSQFDRFNYTQQNNNGYNLSTIQENSKERSNYTSSSSSSRGSTTTANFTRSASAQRSVSSRFCYSNNNQHQ